MRTKFLTFFSVVAFVAVLSVLDSWIQQIRGEVSFLRTTFQVGLVALLLYLLWGRSTPGYVLGVGYAVANAILYGYELVQYFFLGNAAAKLPASATVVSVILIFSTALALILLALDYLDYRKRRISGAPAI